VALCKQVSFVTLSVMVHMDKVFSGCRSPMKALVSAMYKLPRDPGLTTHLLWTCFHYSCLMLLCPWFNSPGNPVPFTIHPCDGFFASLKYEMMVDILESEPRIEYVGQAAMKDLAEWLRDCRQVRFCAK
jgi:hypothetical protein